MGYGLGLLLQCGLNILTNWLTAWFLVPLLLLLLLLKKDLKWENCYQGYCVNIVYRFCDKKHRWMNKYNTWMHWHKYLDFCCGIWTLALGCFSMSLDVSSEMCPLLDWGPHNFSWSRPRSGEDNKKLLLHWSFPRTELPPSFWNGTTRTSSKLRKMLGKCPKWKMWLRTQWSL